MHRGVSSASIDSTSSFAAAPRAERCRPSTCCALWSSTACAIPESKLGVPRWLERVRPPSVQSDAIGHQRLLCAMDASVEHRAEVDALVAERLLPLIDVELSIVFYDLTTLRAVGLSEQDGDVRRYGQFKDGGIRRQFVLGLVQSADGIPVHHDEVFDGNVTRTRTLRATLEPVIARFPIRRVIAIADQGAMSADDLAELQTITTPLGEPLEFILAVPERRYGEFVELLEPVHRDHFAATDAERVAETRWGEHHLVVVHDPERAAERGAARNELIGRLEAQAARWCGKLDEHDTGKRARGRPRSDGGARARFYR